MLPVSKATTSAVRAFAAVAAILILSACSGESDGASAVSPVAQTPSASASVSASPTPSSDATSEAAAEDAAGEKAKDVAEVEEGENSVSGDDVQQSVSDQLTQIVGRRPDSVKCPDLKSKVGTKIRCTLTDGSDVYGVTVTATSVTGDSVNFAIRVDDQAQ